MRIARISVLACASLLIGVGIGLGIAWGLLPVEYVNADPIDLRQRHKDDYLRLISAAYVIDGDLARARDRLERVGSAFTARGFGDFITRDQRAGLAVDALGLLGQGLGFGAGPVVLPRVVDAPSASLDPTVVQPLARFRLAERRMISCADEAQEPLLQIIVRDASGKDLPNVPVEIRWADGEDTLVTGLKPERGMGYADFQAAPGSFTVSLPNTKSDPVSDLDIGDAPSNCRNDRGQTPRGWKLVFQKN